MPEPVKKPPKAPAPPPTPPPLELYVEVGDDVNWYPGADGAEQPQAATVAKVGMEHTIVASVFDASLMGVTPQEGCRHMEDPKARIDNSGGGWRQRPLTVAVREMCLQMGVFKWELGKGGQFRLVLADRPPPKPPAPAA